MTKMEEERTVEDQKSTAPAEKKKGRGRPPKNKDETSGATPDTTSELVLREDDQAQFVLPMPVKQGISSLNLATQILHDVRLQEFEDAQMRTPAPSRKVILDAEGIELNTKEGFTEFDRAVLEAIFAQLAAGNQIMTPAMIFRSMTNKGSGTRVSNEMLNEINKSVEKCMYGKVVIPMYNKRKKKVLQLDSNILSFVRAEYSVSGNLAQAYQIQTVPLLFKYCEENGSLIYSPIEMNAIEGMSMTKRSVAIMNYLQRIVVPRVYNAAGESMIAPGGMDVQEGEHIHGAVWLPPEMVLYDDLYDAVATVDNSSKTRWLMDKTRGTVRSILDYWTDTHHIKRWENVTEGRSIVGVRIFFFPILKKYLPALERLDKPATGTPLVLT